MSGREEAGGRRQEAGGRRQEPGARSQEPGARSQEPGARSQEPGARSQEPGARSQEPGGKWYKGVWVSAPPPPKKCFVYMYGTQYWGPEATRMWGVVATQISIKIKK